MTSVKWLTRIAAISEPFPGYQQTAAYRYNRDADDPGTGERMRVRALMIPPGVPEFLTRRRFVEAGPVRLSGRAWSGRGRPPGRGRRRRCLGRCRARRAVGDFAWRGWTFGWDAALGDRELA